MIQEVSCIAGLGPPVVSMNLSRGGARMGSVRRRRLSFWIALAFVVGVVALAVDRTTGDETGPPYDDPLINKLAFYVFIAAALALVALSVIAVVRQIRIRLQLRHRSD
ncbi:MAG: hypothetical protein AABM42_12390 [Actinomycetota bacterium]